MEMQNLEAGRETRPAEKQGYDEKRTFDDPEDKIWTVYNRETEKVDRALVERWKGDMDGLLIFAGLFSAVVTAFIIESYSALKVDPGDTTVALLGQISLQLAAMSNGSQFALPTPSPANATFTATSSAVRVNVCWFLSLTLSLATALAATLVQQWSRHYLQAIQRREVPRIRARIRYFLHGGVERFQLTAIVEAVPALLHLAVFLFLGGLVEFLQPLDRLIGYIVLSAVGICGALYAAASVLAAFSRSCPYRSPLTPGCWYVLSTLRAPFLHGRRYFIDTVYKLRTRWGARKVSGRRAVRSMQGSEASVSLLPQHSGEFRYDVSGSLQQAQEAEALRSDDSWEKHEVAALKWTLDSLTDHSELQPFLEGVPGYLDSDFIGSSRQRWACLKEVLADGVMVSRMQKMLRSCWSNTQSPLRVDRALMVFQPLFLLMKDVDMLTFPRDASLFLTVDPWCSRCHDIPVTLQHYARSVVAFAVPRLPVPDDKYHLYWQWWQDSLIHVDLDTFTFDEGQQGLDLLQNTEFRALATGGEVTVVVLIVYAAYLIDNSTLVDCSISKETLSRLRMQCTHRGTEQTEGAVKVEHLIWSFAARYVGLDPNTLTDNANGCPNAPSWIIETIFDVMEPLLVVPKEHLWAMTILEKALSNTALTLDVQGRAAMWLELEGAFGGMPQSTDGSLHPASTSDLDAIRNAPTGDD